jgi:hypothetical protein
MTFSIIKQIVHVVEGNIKKNSPLEKPLSISAYASVDNGFLGVKIFNITLNYMSYLYNIFHDLFMHILFCDVWVFYDVWVLRHRSMDTKSTQYFNQ